MAQSVKRLPTMRETGVWSLGREHPLEKEMATRSSTLAWKIPWTEKPGRLQSTGSERVRHDWATSLSLSRLVHWFVSALYRVRCVLSLFVCFSSCGQGWVRWSSCLLMTGFVFLFGLLFRWGILHRVLLVVGCRFLFSGGFLCETSHYLMLPSNSSLVV